MVHINLPQKERHRLTFYLAMEEYVARHLKQYEECFFLWQVEPTVIFGRNQLIDAEVNQEYCHCHNIDMVRRKSGGGCVYADMNNIMFSYINTGHGVQFTFDHYIQMVVGVLNSLGLNAIGSSRNDIMIDGKKVSGNAFYHLSNRNIVHGTMLYDTDMQNMVASITPSDTKLVSKGIKSVREHITLLKDYLAISIEEFKTYVITHLCDSEYTLTESEIEKVKEIEKEYITDEFIYGNNPHYTIVKKHRIEGCGDFDVRIELKNNIIKSVNLMGDYFLYGDIDHDILSRLKDVDYEQKAIENALADLDLGNYIMNINNKQFIQILF